MKNLIIRIVGVVLGTAITGLFLISVAYLSLL